MRNEKEAAIKARDFLIDQIGEEKFIIVVFSKNDKWGRPLARFYKSYLDIPKKKSINQAMIDSGHAVPYDGGKKVVFADWNLTSVAAKTRM